MVRGDWYALMSVVGLGVVVLAAILYVRSIPLQPPHRLEARITGRDSSGSKYGPRAWVVAQAADGRTATENSGLALLQCHVGDSVDMVQQGLVLSIDASTCRPYRK